MLQNLVVSFVINFILKQISKVEGAIDWDRLKADIDAKVAELVPGTWFDDEAIAVVNYLVDALHQVLTSGDNLKTILTLLAAENYEGALDELKKLLLSQLPSLPSFALVADEKVDQSVKLAASDKIRLSLESIA